MVSGACILTTDVCREIDEMLKREKCLEILLVLAFNF